MVTACHTFNVARQIKIGRFRSEKNNPTKRSKCDLDQLILIRWLTEIMAAKFHYFMQAGVGLYDLHC